MILRHARKHRAGLFVDEWGDYMLDRWEDQMEWEDELGDCGLFVEDGVYTCGGVGSEDCEFDCPHNYLIGTRPEQVE